MTPERVGPSPVGVEGKAETAQWTRFSTSFRKQNVWDVIEAFAVLILQAAVAIVNSAQSPQKNTLKLWQHKQWDLPRVDAEFVASMEDVWDLSAELCDSQRPKVNFDETSKQLITETHPLRREAQRFLYARVFVTLTTKESFPDVVCHHCYPLLQ